MKKGKAPGCDGLGRHFYYLFWDEVGQLVHQALVAGAQRGFLSDTQKLSIVRLIPKSGRDKKVIANLRPISLMCCDAKIYSKVLTMRMEPFMHQLITNHQNAYVPGRYIGNGIKTLQFIKEHAQDNNKNLIFMNLDVKKAFDSTNYKYMYKILEKVGFGPKFVGYIRTMYTGCKGAVLNMGKTTKMYNLERSCRQGDPISGFTFILIMQGFINRIIHENSISGYVLNNVKHFKITNFADDATLILDKPDDIRKVLEITNDFGRISGLKTHPQKTEVFVVNGTINIDKKLGIQIVDTMKVLGIQFARDNQQEQEINYKPVIDKFSKAIMTFKARNLQIVGKTLATKSLLISKAQYVFSMLYPSNEHLKVLNSMMYNQFWGGSDKIKRIVLAKDYDSGGLKLNNLYEISMAAQASWMGRLTRDDNIPEWAEFIHLYTKSIGGIYALNGNINPKILEMIPSKIARDIIHSWISFNQSPNNTSHMMKHASLYNNTKITSNFTNAPNTYLKKININQVGDFYFQDGTSITTTEAMEIGLSSTHVLEFIGAANAIPIMWKKRCSGHTGNIPNAFKNKEVRLQYRNERFQVEGWPIDKKHIVFYSNKGWSMFAQKCKQATFLQSEREVELTDDQYSAHYHNMKKYNISLDEFRKTYNRTRTLTKNSYYRSYLFRMQHALIYGNSDFNIQGVKEVSPQCDYCKHKKQNKLHVWLECPRTLEFWEKVYKHFPTIYSKKLTIKEKILGTYNEDEYHVNFAKNIIHLHVTKLVFESIHRELPLTVERLVHHIRAMATAELKMPYGEEELPLDFKWQLLNQYLN